MYKEIGNSIYGQIAMGISGRTTYDISTKSYVKLEGGVLSNPILSSYITGFTRALVGECMHNIQQLGGTVVSVTTDGFITNVENLEEKLLKLNEKSLSCLILYRNMREMLTCSDKDKDTETELESNKNALEIKYIESTGLISWKTRGQLGFSANGITAATGFQTRFLDRDFLIEEFSRIIKEDEYKNVIEYVQSGLRSATDIYKKGGHVLAKYTDKNFSLDYENQEKKILIILVKKIISIKK